MTAPGMSYCADLRYDRYNCGSCGIVCSPSSYCSDGQCQEGTPPGCQPPMMTCSSPEGASYCIDPRYDRNNCGGCGIVCPPEGYCGEGQCQLGPPPPPPTCQQPFTPCTIGGMSYCADHLTDRNNCGACGLVCPPNSYCGAGQCQEGTPPAPSCLLPLLMCMLPDGPSYCTDPRYDPGNCGGCNIVCPPGSYCGDGQCQAGPPPPPPMSCNPPLTACPVPDGPGACVDQNTDPSNCGFCGNYCSGGAICQGGQCTAPAP
jgi:hypothetical protein